MRYWGRDKERAVAGVEVADEAFHAHPYQDEKFLQFLWFALRMGVLNVISH